MRNYPTITDRKIRMALVGCGRIAANHFGAMEQHAVTSKSSMSATSTATRLTRPFSAPAPSDI